jgi:hypothetical protein
MITKLLLIAYLAISLPLLIVVYLYIKNNDINLLFSEQINLIKDKNTLNKISKIIKKIDSKYKKILLVLIIFTVILFVYMLFMLFSNITLNVRLVILVLILALSANSLYTYSIIKYADNLFYNINIESEKLDKTLNPVINLLKDNEIKQKLIDNMNTISIIYIVVSLIIVILTTINAVFGF